MSRYRLVMSFHFLVALAIVEPLIASGQDQTNPAPGLPRAESARFLPANEADARKLLAERDRFVREFYNPDPAAMAAIQKSMAEASKLQDKYRHDVALTLSRMSLALGIAAENVEYNDEKRTEVMDRLRQQAARLYAMGPLSLAKVAKMAEGSLSADRVSAGRAKLTAALNQVPGATPLDIAKLDTWMTPPLGLTPRPIIPRTAPMNIQDMSQQTTPPNIVPMTSTDPNATPATELPNKSDSMPPQAKAVPERTLQPAMNELNMTAVQPPPKPREIKPAPPTETWADFARNCAAKFKYSTDQQQTADRILESVTQRAGKAGDTKDAAGHRTVDLLYDELTQRLESIASIEQRQAAANAEPKSTGN